MASRPARMRVKVPVATLLAAVRAERQRRVDAYSDAVKNLPKAIKQHAIDLKQANLERVARNVAHAEQVLSDVSQDRVPASDRRHYDEWEPQFESPIHTKAPTEPEAPNLGQLDRDIALLSAASETELSVGADDAFASYLNGDA